MWFIDAMMKKNIYTWYYYKTILGVHIRQNRLKLLEVLQTLQIV